MGVVDAIGAIGAFFASEVDALDETDDVPPTVALVPELATTGFGAVGVGVATLDDEGFAGVATTGFGAVGVGVAALDGEGVEGVATTGFGFKPQLGDADAFEVDDERFEAVEEAEDVS